MATYDLVLGKTTCEMKMLVIMIPRIASGCNVQHCKVANCQSILVVQSATIPKSQSHAFKVLPP